MSQFSFKFSLFGKKVRMFSEYRMGIVIEKEPQVVCVYATDKINETIYDAIPLRAPSELKGLEYKVSFSDKNVACISVGDIKIVFDFDKKQSSNNKGLKCFPSNLWRTDVGMPWDETMEKLFNEA